MPYLKQGNITIKVKHYVFHPEIRIFHQILLGKFTLITDQKHLVKTLNQNRLEQPAAGRLQRWTLMLAS